MKREITIVRLKAELSAGRMNKILDRALATLSKELEAKGDEIEIEEISSSNAFETALNSGKLRNKKLVIACETGTEGINIEGYQIIKTLNFHAEKHEYVLQGTRAVLIIDGKSDLYTKDLGRRFAFSLNRVGATLPGKSLVEATGKLENFRTLSRVFNLTLEETYVECVRHLINKISEFQVDKRIVTKECAKRKIAVIHASNSQTSTSLALWQLVKDNIIRLNTETDIKEISILNSQITDCRGCGFDTCFHYGENQNCFYGGIIVEKAYPAIMDCDIMVLVCPNYNDSVSANIMAFINRLTALFRANDFSKKVVYALIVSGYSGGDLVAEQIIGAINMNKNFTLPSDFAMLETANDKGDLIKLDGIELRAKDFAKKMLE